MKNFNINDCIYIQITERGWEHLTNTVGIDLMFVLKHHVENLFLIMKFGINYKRMKFLVCYQ
jgi:hypothetical protein